MLPAINAGLAAGLGSERGLHATDACLAVTEKGFDLPNVKPLRRICLT